MAHLTWDEFTEHAEDFIGGGWVFRGECRERPLRTTLERVVPTDGMVRVVAEKRITHEFRRRIHEYVPVGKLPTNLGELLGIMQHFGAPTRLLDVTKSPYVAAFFAMEDEGEQARVVWAFNTRELNRRAGQEYLTRGIVSAADAQKWSQSVQLYETGEPPLDDPTAAGVLGSLPAGPTGDWFEQAIPVVIPYEPTKLSERLTVQQGQFLLPRDIAVPFEEALGYTSPLDDDLCIRRLLIQADQRVRAIERLRLMNITRASLFPGLDGFAQSLRHLLLEESPESRVARFDARRRRREAEASPAPAPIDNS